MQTLTILGSTGSIGVQTLQVVSLNPDRFKIFALTAHQNVSRLLTQCLLYQPRYAVLQDEQVATHLQQQLRAAGSETEVLSGEAALVEVAQHPAVDTVMAGIVGAAGLLPTLAAAQHGKKILLANKEVLVMAGALFMQTAQQHGATVLPVDSEHNAVFQCLPHHQANQPVKRIILTASGGAFRDLPLSALADVTPEQACTHPNWSMGKKITVDSSTMMNKGLEMIEAHWLFQYTQATIEVVLHPQSILHALVEYQDGSMLAQMNYPDMRTPIAHALAWPERIPAGVASLDLLKIGALTFKPLCLERYPCLRLAEQAWQAGGTATTMLNAANEVAVAAFLEGKIKFTDIPILIERALAQNTVDAADSLAVIISADKTAREATNHFIHMRSNKSL
ncbi:MAG: 1-deoxy-D-xylulose-5-phosphate reductoisomerase [Gammaproteobacteria bacterium]